MQESGICMWSARGSTNDPSSRQRSERAPSSSETVELFKITCMTCQARLSVRNRAVLGQIVACPRCGSMVEIAPPAGDATDIDSANGGAARDGDTATSNPAAAPAPDEESIASELAWETTATAAKYKLVAWSLASFVVGGAILGAALFWRGGNIPSGDALADDVLPQEALAREKGENKAPKRQTAAALPTATDQEPSPKSSQETRDETPDTTTNEPRETSPDLPELPSVESDTAQAKAVAPAERDVPPPAESRVARRFDPLDLDPEGMDLAALNLSRPGKDVAEPSTSPAADPAAPPEKGPAEKPALPFASQRVRRDPTAGQHSHPPAAEQQLAQRIAALQIKRMPLGHFLDLVARLGGVPISVAPEQLQMAGITARQEVSLDEREIRLDDVLRRALKPLHLEPVVQGPQVLIVRENADKPRDIDYPIADLLSPTTTAENLARWIRQLIAPTTWQSAGGTGTLQASSDSLRIHHVQQVQYQVLLFLERMRLARKLPPRSRYPVQRIAPAPAYAVLADQLNASTTFTFSHYTPLREIFRHWQSELDAPLLVDWPALGELNLWPRTRVACAAANEPWQQALDEVLEPLGLAWQAVVGGAIQISTVDKVRTATQLELYRLRPNVGQDADRFLSEMRRQTETPTADEIPSSPTVLIYDAGENLLFALEGAASQRRIHQWLAEQGLLDKN